MTIDGREELENARDSMSRNNDTDSIETSQSDSQAEKHDEPKISTVRGMTIDRREELENAEGSILRNNEPILLKPMKGICNHRNRMNRESQPFVECKPYPRVQNTESESNDQNSARNNLRSSNVRFLLQSKLKALRKTKTPNHRQSQRSAE
jgi:hypothetical protein